MCVYWVVYLFIYCASVALYGYCVSIALCVSCTSIVVFVRTLGNHRRESSVFCLSKSATVTRIPIGRPSANHSTPLSLVTGKMAVPRKWPGVLSLTRTLDVFGDKYHLVKFPIQIKRTVRSKQETDLINCNFRAISVAVMQITKNWTVANVSLNKC